MCAFVECVCVLKRACVLLCTWKLRRVSELFNFNISAQCTHTIVVSISCRFHFHFSFAFCFSSLPIFFSSFLSFVAAFLVRRSLRIIKLNKIENENCLEKYCNDISECYRTSDTSSFSNIPLRLVLVHEWKENRKKKINKQRFRELQCNLMFSFASYFGALGALRRRWENSFVVGIMIICLIVFHDSFRNSEMRIKNAAWLCEFSFLDEYNEKGKDKERKRSTTNSKNFSYHSLLHFDFIERKRQKKEKSFFNQFVDKQVEVFLVTLRFHR